MRRFYAVLLLAGCASLTISLGYGQVPDSDYVTIHPPKVTEVVAPPVKRPSQAIPLATMGDKDVETIVWKQYANVPSGYLKLVTPIVSTQYGNMFLLTIKGYRYSYGNDPFEIRCAGYSVDWAGGLSSRKCETTGTDLPVELTSEVRPGGAVPVVVVRIGTPTTVWDFPFLGGEYVGSVDYNAAAFQFVTGETTPAQGANTNNVVSDDQAGTLNVTNGGLAALTIANGRTNADYVIARIFDVNGPANRSVFPNNPANAVMLDTTPYTTPNTGPGIGFMAMTDGTGGRFVGSISAVKESTALDNYAASLVFGARTNGVPNTTTMEKMRIRSTGEVVIGTTIDNTVTKLTVNGNANFSGDANFGGTVTGGNIKAKYQDVAEWVPTTQSLTAGMVVVLDTARTNHVVASTRAYDSTVAGVISARPGLVLGEESDSKAMVATTGRVRVRVDATEHPVAIGDLLVTGTKPGRAMKSIPIEVQGVPMHRPGTVVGKALEPLASGEGEILVLLSLQ